MKVLQVNCVYKKGSTGKIMYDVHTCLCAKGVESVVCYGRGARISEPNVYKFCSELESKFYHLLNMFGWLMYAVCPVATQRLIRIIKKEQPDVVHLHCINGYCVNIYKLLKYLGQSNIKTVVTHHAEFYYTGSCGHAYDCDKFQKKQGCYGCPNLCEATGNSRFDRTNIAWKKMKTAFSYFKPENILFTAVSPWVVSRSQLSPICNQFICKCVTNGIEISIFKPATADEVAAIKARLPYVEGKIILHVSAIFNTNRNNLKGGYYIKQLAKKMPQHQFVVVASVIGNVEGLPKNVYVWGRANGQKELSALYTTADITVIASKRETFSMIVAESLSCGTPIVGFMAGGPESIVIPDYAQFVEYGNLQELKGAVEYLLSNDYNAEDISRKAHERYSKETMTQGYLDAYNELIYGKH